MISIIAPSSIFADGNSLFLSAMPLSSMRTGVSAKLRLDMSSSTNMGSLYVLFFLPLIVMVIDLILSRILLIGR